MSVNDLSDTIYCALDRYVVGFSCASLNQQGKTFFFFLFLSNLHPSLSRFQFLTILLAPLSLIQLIFYIHHVSLILKYYLQPHSGSTFFIDGLSHSKIGLTKVLYLFQLPSYALEFRSCFYWIQFLSYLFHYVGNLFGNIYVKKIHFTVVNKTWLSHQVDKPSQESTRTELCPKSSDFKELHLAIFIYCNIIVSKSVSFELFFQKKYFLNRVLVYSWTMGKAARIFWKLNIWRKARSSYSSTVVKLSIVMQLLVDNLVQHYVLWIPIQNTTTSELSGG